eukprot:XP_011682360.1 PREDICTED: sterile alpha motif domain-containing protein 3 [Strongylocentrotus purpuratus]
MDYSTPALPADITNLLKNDDRRVCDKIYRKRILAIIFDDLMAHSLYPTREEYNCVARSLIKKYPLLADRAVNSTGYDTWKQALRNKFKNTRKPLTQESAVLERKRIFGHPRQNQGRDKAGQPSPIKKAKRDYSPSLGGV